MAPRRPLPVPKRPLDRASDSPARIVPISPTTASIVAQSLPGVNPYPILPLATSAEASVGTSRNVQSITNVTSFIFIY
ncbi:hypothetical protein ACFPA1_08185 [Neobacillus sp. GCM10023253]|uniref:hypothetical protein n=1 Tax=Neobacillus sp. GCM10023253 TaxID=3252644 RepID=UPI0036173ACD